MSNAYKPLPPAPHYPYWRYYCPSCLEFWESELYRDNFVLICPDCFEKEKVNG